METKPDGRHLRVERNRSQIIGAMLELIRETEELPTADTIAERAGVSRRSVFRLFEDRAALLRSSIEHMYDDVLERFDFPDLSGLSAKEKLRGLVGHAGLIYEYMSPFRRTVVALAGDRNLLLEERDRFRELFIGNLRSIFLEIFPAAPATSQAVRDSLQMSLSWSAWSYLRTERGRSMDEAVDVIVHTVSAILVAAGAKL